MATEPDYSRDALARFIDYVVEKGLVHPSTAQGWRVATSKVLEEITPAERQDVRQVDVETTFRGFLRRNPERLSPASVGEYRRRVGRAIEEFVRWVENPGGYGPRAASWSAKAEARPRARPPAPERPSKPGSASGAGAATASDIALEYPLRPDLLAQVVVPRDLTVEEARRMGAFLVTLAVDFRPAG